MIAEGIILREIGVLSRTITAVIEIDAFDLVFGSARGLSMLT